MVKVTDPRKMNETFARAFNERDLAALLSLYEEDALHVDPETILRGREAMRGEFEKLFRSDSTMISKNNFCIEHDDIALLRADWTLTSPEGAVLHKGSTAEIVRRQKDGSWLYVIDHIAAADLPRVD